MGSTSLFEPILCSEMYQGSSNFLCFKYKKSISFVTIAIRTLFRGFISCHCKYVNVVDISIVAFRIFLRLEFRLEARLYGLEARILTFIQARARLGLENAGLE